MPQIKKITDLTAPELDLFSRYSESQLFHINEPKPGIFIAESPNVIERASMPGMNRSLSSSKKNRPTT